jgi:hypothetical protein
MDDSSTSIRAASRKTRVYVFREFLLEKYGHHLQKGDVILDVAGGKGDLSWLLHNVDGIDSVVVDPRVTKNHIVKSVRYLREHPDVARERAIPNLPTFQPLAALIPKLDGKLSLELPRHIRALVDEDLVRALKKFQATNEDDDWIQYWNTATVKAQEIQTLGYGEPTDMTSNQIVHSLDALKTILSAKLIVGFHPDQATDPCLEIAQELGIPFCVIPCCVFPKEFPHRALADGTRVKYYSQLIEYLESKHPSIQKEKLNFNFTDTAKNIALFKLPSEES